jgi:GT2 family glycosyltransferase
VKVSAIVVNRDKADLLRSALSSLERALDVAGLPAEVWVVDNASNDGSRDVVRRDFPDVSLIDLDRNVGFPRAVNAALPRTEGAWILLLNNDATIEPGAVRAAFDRPLADDVGAIAMQMRFAQHPDTVNSAGMALDTLLVPRDRLLGEPVEGEAQQPTEVFGACAGAALYRRAMLDDIGGFDSRIFVYLEDVDVAWRARMRGWRTLYVPQAVVWHHHSATAGHGSAFKYFHVGRNRVRLIARNADGRHLFRYAPSILGYELGYIAYVALADQTLAPLRGRLAGLREWRSLRAEGAASRRPIELERRQGFRAALRRRRAWQQGGTAVDER